MSGEGFTAHRSLFTAQLSFYDGREPLENRTQGILGQRSLLLYDDAVDLKDRKDIGDAHPSVFKNFIHSGDIDFQAEFL